MSPFFVAAHRLRKRARVNIGGSPTLWSNLFLHSNFLSVLESLVEPFRCTNFYKYAITERGSRKLEPRSMFSNYILET
jgi:hypothetical protein